MEANTAQFYLSHFNSSMSSDLLFSPTKNTSMQSSNLAYTPLEHLNPVHSTDISHTRSETEDYTNPDDELEIRVEGIPNTGGKSRVETQIRLSIQLTTKNGVKAPYWSYLRINESMLARSKLKKSQHQKLLDGSAAAMVSDESKVLDLEARVVCESDENKKIKMCLGCVRRERKRAQRKKNFKPSSYKMNPNVVDGKFESDRQRVLIFNCESLVNFSTGEAILPTRITCYCRHHNERIGFRIRFTVRNSKGVVVATGDTPPVMITDDHKSTKQNDSTFIQAFNSRKRLRESPKEYEDESDMLSTPASSRRNSYSSSETGSDSNQLFSSTSSSPIASQNFLASHDLNPRHTLNSSVHDTLPPQTPDTPDLWQNVMNVSTYGQLQIPDFKMSDLHRHGATTQQKINYPIMLQENEFGEQEALPPTRRRRRLDDNILLDTCNPSFLTMDNVLMNYDEILFNNPISATSTLTADSPGSLDEPLSCFSPNKPLIPIVNSITPSQGPTYGGIEVTIAGEGFHQDLTLMFGNRAATTICCSSTFMVCLLPPIEEKGSVTISFRDHPLLRSSEMPASFTYFEQEETKLIDFSLHAIGLQSNIQTVYQNRHQWQNVESEVIQALSNNCLNFSSLSSQTNLGGQNLLHLSAYFNLSRLIGFLALRNPELIHSVDRNGLTPLHFACLRKSTQAISALLKVDASVAQTSNMGTAMDIVANSLNPFELEEIEKQVQLGGVDIADIDKANASVTWLPNLFVYAAIQFCQRINSVSATNVFFQQQTNMANQKNDALFYNL